MAASLNKSRVRDSWMVALFCAFLFATTRNLAPAETVAHEVLDLLGYILVAICALGRLYTTAFLGGHKNATLITYGPFSVVRNPLYLFSLIGVTGIGLISMHIWVMVLAPISIATIYYFLIKREEAFLLGKFGDAYRDYMQRVPRFIPRLSLYEAPPQVSMAPDRLLAGALDAIWWFAPLPLFELLETFHL